MTSLRKDTKLNEAELLQNSMNWNRTPLSEKSNTPARALFKGDKRLLEKGFSASTGDITKKDKYSTRVAKKDIKYDIIPKEKNKTSIKDYGRTTTLVAENNKAVHSSLSANQPKSRESFVTEAPQKNKYISDNDHKDDSSISVAVRLRPFSSSEVLSGHKNAVSMNGNITTLHSENGYTYDFNFDHSLWSFDRQNQSAPYVTQEEIFQRIAKPLLNWSLDGYNTCLFAYGQTGSGKSYTMMGYEGDEGIIPRFSNSLFQSISAGQQRCSEKIYSAQISFFEIYNEKIFDLLSVNDMGKQRLCVREHPDYGPYVQGLALHNVGSHKDTVDWLEVGNKNRATASTGMNDKSSRSHSVFTILLSQVKVEKFEGTETQLQRSSKINLIDLAGSERVTKVLDSDAVRNCLELASARMKEGSCINKSLHTLGKVISLLSEISSKKRSTFIPYRDSVLTWLLKESLGGNAKTTMLATIAPSQVYASETLSTLRYAHQARSIVNKAKINEDRTSQLIREMLAEIKHLKAYQRRSGCNSLEKEVAELRQKLKDAQGELALATKNWQEDVAKSNVLQKTAARNLRQSGVAFGKVENQRPSLVNLNEDPQLAEILLYLLNDGETLIGRSKSMEEGNIILNGNLVADVHCALTYANGVVTLVPFDDCASYVNGELVTDEVTLHHGDRIVIGGDHFFRFNHPKEAKSMQRSIPDGVLKDFNFAKTELQEKQNQRLEDEIEQARLDAEELAMNKIREAQVKAEESILLQKHHFEEQLLMLQKRLDASNEEKHQAVQEEQHSKEIITQLKSQQKHLEEQIASNRERLQMEANRARQVFEETKSNQKKIIEELEMQRKKIEDDINKLKSSKEKVKVRSSILVPVNEKGDFDLLKISMLIREANEISKRFKQSFIFSRDDFCLDGEVQLQIRVKDTQKCQTALMTLEDFNEELVLMREQGCFDEGVSNLYKKNLVWEKDVPLVKKSSRLSVSNDVSDNLIESLNKSMEMSAKRYDELFSFQTNKTLSGGNLQDTTDNEICKMNTSHTYLESSRLSSVHVYHHATKSEETICDNAMRASFIDSMLDECGDKNEVSIMSSLIQRIFQIYYDYNTQVIDDTRLMNMACSIKGLKISASMLCSVHEAVGLDELKKMCRLFRKLVTDAATCFKSQASEITFGINQRKKQDFNKIIMQLVEVSGALSLAAVDHVSEEDNNSYFSDGSSKNLSKHFLEHQNKFLVSMFNEAESTVQNGIKDIRYLQINASHEMSDDLVDDVMNILTSCTTLLNRGKDFMMVYADVCVLNNALYYAKECFILRKILASLVDLNENIQNVVQHSTSIAKNVDNLEEFIELPIELADTTKCLCKAAEQLTTFSSLTKHLDEEMIVLLQDCFDKFEFASKAVRVGATILVQEIEKDMNVNEEQSVVSLVQSDVEFKRNRSLCPLNRSHTDMSQMEVKLQSKLRWDRRSSVNRDMFISRYMDSNDDSELSQR